MGRKIPKRKHMGIRDPMKQLEEREAKIKDKINHPPEKRDFQKVSHSLARFIELKESIKTGKLVKQKNTQLKRFHIDNEDTPENYKNVGQVGKGGKGGKGEKKEKSQKSQESRNNKEFTNLKQGSNETDRGFMRRVNRVTQDSVEEAKFEAKYGVEVVRNSKTGEIKLKKKQKNEIDERLKQNMENQKRLKKGAKAIPTAIVLAPEEKKKLIKAMLAEKKQKQKESKEPEIEEFKRDDVKFGEVVNAPPLQLTVPRRAQPAETVPRPGKKALLLHSVIDEYSDKTNEPATVVETKSPKIPKNPRSNTIGTLKGKRKDLSMAMRQMIDTEQENVVKLYKELKKSQRLENAKKK